MQQLTTIPVETQPATYFQDVFKALATHVAVEHIQNSSVANRLGVHPSLLHLPIRRIIPDCKWSLNRYGKPYQPIGFVTYFYYDLWLVSGVAS